MESNGIVVVSTDLPSGWTMIPSSRMPPNDKYPWWKSNPQFLEGDAAQEFPLLLNHPARASRICAVIYGKDSEMVVVLSITYDTVQHAEQEFHFIQDNANPKDWPFVHLSARTNTIILMNMTDGCSASQFFTKLFKE